MENDNDEQAPVRRSYRMSAMMDVMNGLRDGDMDALELEQARAADNQFFSLINLILTRGLDQFVSSTSNNNSVKTVCLDIGYQRIYDDYGRQIGNEEYYRRWERLALGLGQLKGLKELRVNSRELLEDPENVPDYRALGKVLSGVPQLQNLSFCCSLLAEGDIAQVATSLHKHPSLLQVQFEQRTDTEALDGIARQLLTVPNLETVEFGFLTIQRRRLPDSIFALVGMKSHKCLRVHKCLLSQNQCQLMSSHFRHANNSKLSLLDLQHSRIEGTGGTQILQGLQQNDTIQSLRLSLSSLNQPACDALATLVSTSPCLGELRLTGRSFIDLDNGNEAFPFDSEWLGPLFDNLQQQQSITTTACSLKVLSIGAVDNWSYQLTDKFRAALESEKCPLETLTMNAHNMAPNWPRLMPSLATNTSLCKLSVGGGIDRHGAIALASHLSQNSKLEELTMIVIHDDERSDDNEEGQQGDDESSQQQQSQSQPPQQWDDNNNEDNHQFTMARCVRALSSNTTLRRLDVRFPHRFEVRDVSPKGTRELEAAFMRNYSLEEVTGRYDRDCHVPILCQLNRAGRKYLITDPLNRPKGIQVLAQVSGSLNAIYYHLLENPALCCCEDVVTPPPSSTTTTSSQQTKRKATMTTAQGESKRMCLASV